INRTGVLVESAQQLSGRGAHNLILAPPPEITWYLSDRGLAEYPMPAETTRVPSGENATEWTRPSSSNVRNSCPLGLSVFPLSALFLLFLPNLSAERSPPESTRVPSGRRRQN